MKHFHFYEMFHKNEIVPFVSLLCTNEVYLDDNYIDTAVLHAWNSHNRSINLKVQVKGEYKFFLHLTKFLQFCHLKLFISKFIFLEKKGRTGFTWNKNLVWHSHNFVFSCITVEQNFIICPPFIFKLYFLCF